MVEKARGGASLFDRDGFSEGGGGFQEGDITVESARFGKTDYRGSAKVAVTAFLLKFSDDEGQDYEEIYSIGKKAQKVMQASSDGKRLVARPGQQEVQLNSKCKAGMFFLSALDAGYEIPDGADPKDASNLDGLRLSVKRRAMPKLENVEDQKDATVLLVTNILETTSRGKASSKASTKASSKATAASNGFDERVAEYVQKVIEEGGGEAMKLSDLRRGLFKIAKGEDDAKEITVRATERDFYEDQPQFEFDGTTVGLS